MAAGFDTQGPSELEQSDDRMHTVAEKASFIAIITGFLILAIIGFIAYLIRSLYQAAKEEIAVRWFRSEIDKLEQGVQQDAPA